MSEPSSAGPELPELPSSLPTNVLTPPVDMSNVQGPPMSSTSSQLSPLGSPVHQTPDSIQTSAALTLDTLSLEAQTSTPTSPYFKDNSEIKSGSVFAQFGSTGTGDDAFTSILSMSDSDRRHDAWIPSDATSHILKTIATSHPGTFQPMPEQLSTPGVLTSEPQVIICVFLSVCTSN